MRRARKLGLAVAVALAAVPTGWGAAAEAQTGRSQASLLFLAQADAGTLRPVRGSSSQFVLTLRRPDERVISFTERPARRAGSEELRDFGTPSDAASGAHRRTGLSRFATRPTTRT